MAPQSLGQLQQQQVFILQSAVTMRAFAQSTKVQDRMALIALLTKCAGGKNRILLGNNCILIDFLLQSDQVHTDKSDEQDMIGKNTTLSLALAGKGNVKSCGLIFACACKGKLQPPVMCKGQAA